MLNLKTKSAIITGASSGIGWATSILFRRLGASLLLTGRNTERLAELARELRAIDTEGAVHTISADLENESDVKRIADAAKDVFSGKLDILVNNAGILEKGTIEDTTLSSYNRVMNVNLRSVFLLTNLLVPHMGEKGAIVNVSSVNGIRSFPGVLAYNISKAGLDQLTRCASLELASKGIRVNSINPGVTVTELHARSGMATDAYAAFLERAKSTHPLGRAGTVDECATAIAFLASEAASFITGVSLPVDGGRHAACPR